MIIDFHTHIHKSLFGYGQTQGQLIKKMTKYGIDMAVVCPVKPPNYHFGPENNYISRTVAKYPEKFVGFGRVDPYQGVKAVKEVERCALELNLKGLFLHPWEETFPINDDIVLPIIEAAEKFNLPVMIAGGFLRVSRAFQIADLVNQFPKVTFIVTSGGQINISGSALFEAESMIKENDNVIMETSGIYREDFIEETVQKYGKERVVFGSGSPQYHIGLEVKRAQWAHLEKDEIESISWKNAANILKLKI